MLHLIPLQYLVRDVLRPQAQLLQGSILHKAKTVLLCAQGFGLQIWPVFTLVDRHDGTSGTRCDQSGGSMG